MPAIADAVEARRRAAEVGHHEKECGERIDPEVRAQARQSDRQHHRLDRGSVDQRNHADREGQQRGDQTAAVDKERTDRGSRRADRGHCQSQQRRNAPQCDQGRHLRQILGLADRQERSAGGNSSNVAPTRSGINQGIQQRTSHRFPESETFPQAAGAATTGPAAPFRPRMDPTIPQLRQAEVTAIGANGVGPEPEGRT